MGTPAVVVGDVRVRVHKLECCATRQGALARSVDVATVLGSPEGGRVLTGRDRLVGVCLAAEVVHAPRVLFKVHELLAARKLANVADAVGRCQILVVHLGIQGRVGAAAEVVHDTRPCVTVAFAVACGQPACG